jgi:hypothetical protein
MRLLGEEEEAGEYWARIVTEREISPSEQRLRQRLLKLLDVAS